MNHVQKSHESTIKVSVQLPSLHKLRLARGSGFLLEHGRHKEHHEENVQLLRVQVNLNHE